MKKGLMNYAQVRADWAFPAIQKWIKRKRFSFVWKEEGISFNIITSGSDPTHLWVASEIFIDKVYDLSLVPFIPDMILDLGANIGLFTVLAAKQWPGATFICVEPHPKTFSFLSSNLEANNVKATKLQCAVSDSTEIKSLGNEGAVFQEVRDFDNTSENQILTIPLDSLIPKKTDTKLLVKMDIEGAEDDTLKGKLVRLPENCFIFIELHKGDESLEWMEKWANKNNFRFSLVRRRKDAIDAYLKRL